MTKFQLSRRLILAVALLAAGAATAAPFKAVPDDRALGRATAPVTVVEYGSVGCSHCADWDLEVFPAFKAKYIDTGKVRFVYRELLTGHPQLTQAGFLTLRCLPRDRYFPSMHAIYARQRQMIAGGTVMAELQQIASASGVDEAAWRACLTDQAAVAAMFARSDANAAIDEVDGTPAFVVNGVVVEDQSLAGLGAAIAAAKRKR